ncbi:MAG: PQQ-binding-like beta-propeller repeat protein [Planctomycetia bacterium]|nr:PQQ-binding-like beta-propeller repeat protein [Planctomycetia bacterium]
MLRTSLLASLTAVGLSVPALPAAAQEWTRFRGPNGAGISAATTVPATWTEKDYNWQVELPGIGHSSPVLWGDRIFLTSANEETGERTAVCLSTADGHVLWQRQYASKIHPKHLRNSFASPTPAVDERQVYFSWSTPDEYTLLALDHDGNEKWKLNLGPYVSQHSAGPSPIIYQDMVILGNDQDGASSLVSVDRANGQLRWQTPRQSQFVSYATPCVLKRDGLAEELIFLSGAHGVSGVDPKTGKTRWEISVFDKRTVASPVLAGGLVLGSCGSGAGGNYVAAVRPGTPDGSVAPEEVWRITDSAPYVPTMVAKGDLVFLWSDKGVASCVQAADGKVLWKQRVGGNYSGSPVCAGDRLYCIGEDGVVVVLAASEKYELLGRNPLGEDSRSTPTVADGRMYLRTYSHLTSIGGKK